MGGCLAPCVLSVFPSPDVGRGSDDAKQIMKINHYFTCVLMCVLIALGAASMPAEERNKCELNQQLHERRIEYRDALRKALDGLQQRKTAGVNCTGCVSDVSKARITLLHAELALESESQQRLKVLEGYVKELKQDEQYYRTRFDIGSCRRDELSLAVAQRIHGEILLLEEQEQQRRP